MGHPVAMAGGLLPGYSSHCREWPNGSVPEQRNRRLKQWSRPSMRSSASSPRKRSPAIFRNRVLCVSRGVFSSCRQSNEAIDTYKEFDLADDYVLLDEKETQARIKVAGSLGSLFTPNCAVVHPAKLARGLARIVEGMGVTIYEQTAVTDYTQGQSPRLITDRGDVRARTLVLAGESYLSQLPKLSRQLIPVYSLIVLTEPLSDQQWEEIGWESRECVSSNRFTVDYLSKTTDGRIVFGGRGAPYHYNSQIADEYDRYEPTHSMLRQMTVDWFPMLKDVRFTHAWGGPLGMPRDWMPTMTYDPSTHVASARGYTGQGVATANLSGRVLTDLITGKHSELTELPTVDHHSPDWEPEPFRWLGIRYVQNGFGRLDEEAERTGRAPSGRSLTELLGRH